MGGEAIGIHLPMSLGLPYFLIINNIQKYKCTPIHRIRCQQNQITNHITLDKMKEEIIMQLALKLYVITK